MAESLGKHHFYVVQDIEGFDVTKEFSLLNFEECPYTAQNGQKYRAYVMTRDGFLRLALRYRGKKADGFKEAFIRDLPHGPLTARHL